MVGFRVAPQLASVVGIVGRGVDHHARAAAEAGGTASAGADAVPRARRLPPQRCSGAGTSTSPINARLPRLRKLATAAYKRCMEAFLSSLGDRLQRSTTMRCPRPIVFHRNFFLSPPEKRSPQHPSQVDIEGRRVRPQHPSQVDIEGRRVEDSVPAPFQVDVEGRRARIPSVCAVPCPKPGRRLVGPRPAAGRVGGSQNRHGARLNGQRLEFSQPLVNPHTPHAHPQADR